MSEGRSFDVLVVGAGPAGIAAACAAAECGRRVGVVDDNPAAGGQIWRGACSGPAGRWLARFRESGAAFLAGTRIIDRVETGVLLAESADTARALGYGKLIVATGARERFLPFPGWTLPNVMGAGGLQALVKDGLDVARKRVLVAGTGPLLLAVAAYLRKRGAAITVIAEQAPWNRLAQFALGLARQPSKIAQALALQVRLGGARYAAGCWPIASDGGDALESVVLRSANGDRRVLCDYLACGFGLVPNLELPMLMGCEIRGGFVTVDEWQQTSVTGVYCAGEPTGIGGVDLALSGGLIAGCAAADRPRQAHSHFADRARAARFKDALDTAFALRHGSVPGPRLRSGDRVSVRLEAGIHSPADFPRAAGPPDPLVSP